MFDGGRTAWHRAGLQDLPRRGDSHEKAGAQERGGLTWSRYMARILLRIAMYGPLL